MLPNIEIWPKSHCSDWKSLEFKPVDCRVVHHEVRPVVYNKAIFKLHATSLDKKVMRITSEIEIEAMSKQRIDRSNGNSNSREQQHDKHNEAGAGG